MKDKKVFNCYKKCILKIAKEKYPNVRERSYSLEYYLDNFITVLNDVNKWESLKLINKDTSKYHWKTIYNEYNKWCSDDIFKIAYEDFLKKHYFKMAKLRKNKKINMFIDVTKITNKRGSDNVGVNCEYKKKNVTALSIVVDDNKIPIGVVPVDTNLKKTTTGKNTIQHDVKAVQKTLDSIPFTVKPYVKVNIIGDKGYITSNKFKVMDRELSITTPKRKNQKKKNTKREEKLLSKRHKIENYNANLKRKNRICLRQDGKIKTYMSFIYMTMIESLCNYMNNMN